MGKKGKSRKGTQRGNASQRYHGGDIPAPAMRTYRTVSCALPRITEECVVRGTQVSALVAQATSSQNPTYYFSLNNFNVGTGFWDQYKIEAIRFSIVPTNNAIGLYTNSTTLMTPLYCVIDYDDASALTTAAACQAYSTCVTLNPGESCERVFQPRLAMAAYNGTFGGYVSSAPQWIDANSNTVQHYGVKLFIPGVTAAQTQLQSWNITIEAFVRFRRSI